MGDRHRTGDRGDAGSSAGVPGVVQPLPALHNKAVKFGEVEEGQSCDLYAEGVFAHTYEKVHPQDAGGTKINAILVGEPQLEVGRKVWISADAHVYIKEFHGDKYGDKYDSCGA